MCTWIPLLESTYSGIFDYSCNQYTHYLDTVLNGLEGIRVGEKEKDNNDYISIFHISGIIYSDDKV